MSEGTMLVGFRSALNFWRMTRAADLTQDDFDGRVLGARRLETGDLAGAGLAACGCEPPLDVVVPSTSARHCCELVRDHIWNGPIPLTGKCRVGADIEVCSIPLVLVQLAAETQDTVGIMMIAYEMTGTYGLTPWRDSGFEEDVVPLTSVAELRDYARSARALGVRGAARACEALSHVKDGSASPRETDLAILMALPRRKGGFGLGDFTLNKKTDLRGMARELLGRSTIRTDFLWKREKSASDVMLEYESDECHLEPWELARDTRRREALAAAGHHVHCITNDQLKDYDHLCNLMESIASELKVRRSKPSPVMETRRRELFERVVYGIGAEIDA
jgi:hypothetical protein